MMVRSSATSSPHKCTRLHLKGSKRVIAFQAVKLQDDPTSVYCHHLPLRTGGPEEVGAVVGRRALVLGGPVATASLGSAAVRGCVDERDQRDGKEGEQHDCYRLISFHHI